MVRPVDGKVGSDAIKKFLYVELYVKRFAARATCIGIELDTVETGLYRAKLCLEYDHANHE